MDEYGTSETIAYIERIKDKSLVEIAHDINRCHQAASITARKLAIDCARIGALLLVAKGKCRSENFPWLSCSLGRPSLLWFTPGVLS